MECIFKIISNSCHAKLVWIIDMVCYKGKSIHFIFRFATKLAFNDVIGIFVTVWFLHTSLVRPGTLSTIAMVKACKYGHYTITGTNEIVLPPVVISQMRHALSEWCTMFGSQLCGGHQAMSSALQWRRWWTVSVLAQLSRSRPLAIQECATLQSGEYHLSHQGKRYDDWY